MKEQTLLGGSGNLGVLCALMPKLSKEFGLQGDKIFNKWNKNWRFRKEISGHILSLINDKSKKSAFEMASDILGDDFISPEAIAEKMNIKYSDQQIQLMYNSMPFEESWYLTSKERNYLLCATPSRPMSLLDIRTLNMKNFYSESDGWYDKKKEQQAFSATNYVNQSFCEFWLALKKTAVDGSFSASWNDQKKLILPDEFIPNVPQATWPIVVTNLGVLSHANAFELSQKLKNDYLLWVKQDYFLE